MLGEARDEIAKSGKLWEDTAYKALREQQDGDYGLSGSALYEFTMPEDAHGGKWDNMTTNLFVVTANKVIGLLTSSWLQLFIDLDEETRKKRTRLTATEQLANGCIYLANRVLTSVPSGKDIQSLLSSYACIMGGTVKSVLLTENEDGGLSPNLKVYNPMQCQWEEGEDLTWFCYRNYVQESWLKKKYKDNINVSPDSKGRILTHTFFDENEWKLAVDDKYIDESAHGLGYIPVNIRTVGAMPPIQSEKYEEAALKHAWQSIYANDRNLADIESELLSIGRSMSKESGVIKVFGEYNSDLAGTTNINDELEKAGYTTGKGRNQKLLFDTAKGEKFGGFVPPPAIETIDKFRAIIRGMAIIGMIDPIAFGQMTRTGSGALAAELRSAALEFVNPFKKCIEDDFIWIAEECVKQFKNGQFEKVQVEGRDYKRMKFTTKIKPEDVEEVRFDCNLVTDRLRDEVQEVNLAVQKVQNNLTSARTARIQGNIVEDADREQDIIAEEMAMKDPVYIHTKLAEQFHKDGDNQMAMYHQALAAIEIKKTVDQAASMGLIPSAEAKPAETQTGFTEAQPERAYVQGQTETGTQPAEGMGGIANA